MLKKVSFYLLTVFCLTPLCAQTQQAANELHFSLDGITAITISYDEENITFFESKDNNLTIKEFMTENKKSYYAKVSENSNSIHISEGNKPRIGRFSRFVEVYLPRSYRQNLMVTSTNGSVDMSNVVLHLNGLRVDNTSGTITIADASAPVIHISSTSGNIRCSKLNGMVIYESTNGNLDAASATGSGNYRTSSSGKLNVTYTKVNGDLSFHNRDDDISLTLPENLSFTFEAVTKNGSIRTSFQQYLTIEGRSVSGTVGDNPVVNIFMETNDGNIEVLQR